MNLPELFQKIRSNLILFESNFKAPIYIDEDSCFRPFRTVWRGLFCCKIYYFHRWGLLPPHPPGPLKLPWKYIFLTLPLSTICNENIGQYLHLGLTPVFFLYPLSIGQIRGPTNLHCFYFQNCKLNNPKQPKSTACKIW